MKDIFEILQHENHELEVIQHNNEYILGCKTCGKTLLTEEYICQNVKDYAAILETLKGINKDNNKDRAALISFIKMLGIYTLKIDEQGIEEMRRYVLSDLAESLSKDYIASQHKVNAVFDIRNLVYNLYKYVYCIENYNELIRVCYSEDAWEAKLVLIKDKLLIALKKDEAKYTFYDNHETVTTGCKTYKINDNDIKKYKFFSIHNEISEKLEEECPTPTDVYVFKDKADFYSKEPNWEDEEEENVQYREYIYRIENDLYDFSNLGEDFIIKNAIDYYAEYEGIERYIIPLQKALKEKYNIEL